MEIDVLIESEFKGCLEPSWLRSIVEQILIAQGIGPNADLSVVITGQEGIRELNRDCRGKDEPTDVLAFAMVTAEKGKDEAPFITAPDGILHFGEVIISYPQAAIQAGEQRHSAKREIAILLVHGVLHLLGYEHDKVEPGRKMRAKESEILALIEENTPLD